jgi:thiamine biosynthesis lipoprotein
MRKPIWLATLLLIVTGWAAAGCFSERSVQPQPYRETRFLMDTVIEITAYGPGAEPAVQAALAEFERIQAISDRFSPDSQVTHINQLAGVDKVVVDPCLLNMVNRAKEMSEQTDGAFDISVGPLTRLWDVGHKGDYVPTQAELEQVLPLIGYSRVAVDMAAHTVYLSKPGMSLDLGGIAKGYAINQAVEILKAKGIQSALVNAGGDIRTIGQKPDGTPWRIGVQDPRNPDGMIVKIALTEWDMLETSGDYQRYFIKDGIRYAHILNPKTGLQSREVASVTLVYKHQRSGLVPSSAFQVLGVERGLMILQRFPGVEAIFVTVDGRIVTTPGLAGKVEITSGQ